MKRHAVRDIDTHADRKHGDRRRAPSPPAYTTCRPPTKHQGARLRWLGGGETSFPRRTSPAGRGEATPVGANPWRAGCPSTFLLDTQRACYSYSQPPARSSQRISSAVEGTLDGLRRPWRCSLSRGSACGTSPLPATCERCRCPTWRVLTAPMNGYAVRQSPSLCWWSSCPFMRPPRSLAGGSPTFCSPAFLRSTCSCRRQSHSSSPHSTSRTHTHSLAPNSCAYPPVEGGYPAAPQCRRAARRWARTLTPTPGAGSSGSRSARCSAAPLWGGRASPQAAWPNAACARASPAERTW